MMRSSCEPLNFPFHENPTNTKQTHSTLHRCSTGPDLIGLIISSVSHFDLRDNITVFIWSGQSASDHSFGFTSTKAMTKFNLRYDVFLAQAVLSVSMYLESDNRTSLVPRLYHCNKREPISQMSQTRLNLTDASNWQAEPQTAGGTDLMMVPCCSGPSPGAVMSCVFPVCYITHFLCRSHGKNNLRNSPVPHVRLVLND